MDDPRLTIREVADRTGVSAATLRVWETRFGFPEPRRLPSGHRRFSEADVERVLQVARDRDSGLSIRVAIDRALRATAVPEESVYAALRRHRPDLQPYLLSKETLIALSHAIEDECCARAERPILFGSFQRVAFYRNAQPRWRELARTARSCFVFADFEQIRAPADDAAGEVPIDRSGPLGREWSLVCDAPGYAAFLSGWERPGQDAVADSKRRFETIWSVEPQLVREAARICAGLVERAAPELTPPAFELLRETPAASDQSTRLVGGLTNRMVAYVGRGEASDMPAPHRASGD
ncbi:MAG: hypothetical protein NVS2B6_12260 [Thermoleophilaceae bacterium]